MDQLTYTYKNLDFSSFMKAQFRKYLDIIYANHNVVVDVARKVEGDVLTIFKVHKTSILFKDLFFVEKIEIDRNLKTYKSSINTFNYTEECFMEEQNGNIKYVQNYSVPFFMKGKKKQAFDKGCEIVEKIINELKLRTNF